MAASLSSANAIAPSLAVHTINKRVQTRSVICCNAPKKVDIKKQGLEGVDNDVVRANLKGQSRFIGKKGWVDSSGRSGTGKGVYKFESKYGTNVDGYSPIYTPDVWSESGEEYSLGTKGIIAWLGLVVVLLGVGLTLILSTSQLGA